MSGKSTITIKSDDAKPSTHYQVKQVCKKCGSTIIYWVDKTKTKLKPMKCLDCDEEDEQQLRLYKMPEVGMCNRAAVWDRQNFR